MLDDFRQDKQEQPLDPLSDGPAIPFGKKIGLLCLAVALIGLFIFFTSDSWGSDSKTLHQDELAVEVDHLKQRVADLESKLSPHPIAVSSEVATVAEGPTLDAPTAEAPAMANLKSLIEQELQDSATEAAPAADAIAKADTAKKPVQKLASKQTYTVKKGDTLSKIAHQFYGSSKKWKKIVEANKDKLGQSQVLKAGMTLVIPKE